jgi:hypothetical protein
MSRFGGVFGFSRHNHKTQEKIMKKQVSWRLCLVLASLFSASAMADHSGADGGNAVTKWSAVAIQVLPTDPGLLADSRAFAILHAAIHDAVNGVERRYEPYTVNLSSPHASVDAAIAAASHDVLFALSPSQRTVVEIAYQAALLAIPNGSAKDAGILVGRQSAAANLARRVGDGLEGATSPPYAPNGKAGDYDFTPPFDQPPLGPGALFPGWGRIAPFGMQAGAHTLPGPDALTSDAYIRDFKLLKSIGKHDSRTRTREQTDIALFWFEFSPMGWNRITNTLVRQERLDVWRSARLLALVNFALADGYIAGFEAKYHFRFWRPVTAIRKADSDGNGATTADKTWLPLSAPAFFTPPVPDYPSTHTVLGAAVAEVLIQQFGDRIRFSVVSTTLPGAVRDYVSLSDAAHENGLSRVFGGIHFLRAVQDGCRQGKGIGRAISQLLPRAGKGATTSSSVRSKLCVGLSL